MNQETKQKQSENSMRKIKIEKVLLSAGSVSEDLQKAKKLLELISGKKAQLISSTKRIPDFNVRPGLEVGTRVTLRGPKALEVLKQLLGGVGNTLYEDQVSENHFSFGIKEYIEIPGIEYQRELGIRGFNITVVFARPGIRVKRKKIKTGKFPKKQHISQEEILKYMEENFQTSFI
ncbi:50S ribosomal protein L5 [Candidatus Pacearchaeota archaeon]|nr:50S ribosomal protein L5 [Candidatus Pacearchaeota archaeon]|tara:strand:- start:9535 stop:10062 length:528 start_codon:yes stop_codon:yes gene_type:complete